MKNLNLKNLFSLFALVAIAVLTATNNHASAGVLTAGFGGAIGRMERESFDNFDPEIMNFDPETVMGYDLEGYDLEDNYDDEDEFNGKRRSSKRTLSALSQIDIVINNSAISASTTIELFNYLRSNTIIRNTTYNGTTFEPQTFDKSFLRATPASGQLLSDAHLIYWRSDGTLVYSNASGTGATPNTSICTISCTQVPYRVVHEATRNNLLYIEKMRISYKTAPQIDQSFNYFKNSFVGGITQNNIAPRSEFKPNQFQTLIVDVPMKIRIDAERGLSYTMISQEVVTLTMFFRFERGNAY
jgi:hypothetical protein